ncbi:uncharacterized protein GGS22DRAFT_198738 [Annulohypoxylon maeteangense]|uniref:uncharacterized protein n=1 Tax=Annulohypoxylon maeteangense TaxID=1927788 RepID=UPI0020080A89|nr:uncharacterized protein GGS22DRAFT_198738 [Annulohypoxylon maeteangense]KAI0887454.1 hypothetical protein GGS22DRAFT_198738 [Annulohypoxylon maeteangense]
MPPLPCPTKEHIRQVFSHFAEGNAEAFYAHVADDVDLTLTGSHALAGRYDKATFRSQALARVNCIFDGPVKLHVRSIIGGEVEEWAVIELTAEARCKNGLVYDQTYSWSTRWKDGKIVEVRTYMDGLLLNKALAENENES